MSTEPMTRAPSEAMITALPAAEIARLPLRPTSQIGAVQRSRPRSPSPSSKHGRPPKRPRVTEREYPDIEELSWESLQALVTGLKAGLSDYADDLEAIWDSPTPRQI